ncbi:MAG: putative DNA binding domain-containing protein [Anaerolineaceae bacterium]|nr:putative DNA binding domain-containing protein [Anaerolineaceae bacterium]
MNIAELLSGESRNIEYKQEIPSKSDRYMKSVIAFANGTGGKIVFGVEDKTNRVIGFRTEDILAKIDAITNAIWDSCEPKVPADVYPCEIDGKTIIIAEIPRGSMPPYCLKGYGLWDGTFLRLSGTTRLAPEYMIKEMMLESMNQSFDRRKTERVLLPSEIDALCERLYAHALDRVVPAHQEEIKKIGRSQLISYGLIIEEDGKEYASNGYQLLDGAGFYEDAMIQCARFKGNTRGVFIDRKDYSGPIDEQVESAVQFVLNHINLGSRFIGVGRQYIYELPYRSIREIIANAVCHRSYLADEKIQVAVYDDRLEVTSPGMLYRDMTIEKMKEGRSKIRNKGIAAVFAYMHLIEGWGSGIPKIMREAKEYGLREPELIDMDGAFRINLYRRTFDTDTYGVIDPRENVIREEDQGWIKEKHAPDHSRKKMPLHQQILVLLADDPYLTQEILCEKTGVSLRTVKRAMKTLQEDGYLVRKGNRRNGTWTVVEK